ncbi:hypothetical protein OIU77_001925, partial [Salix suchowensis]
MRTMDGNKGYHGMQCCICPFYSINILQIITLFILRRLLNSQLYVPPLILI